MDTKVTSTPSEKPTLSNPKSGNDTTEAMRNNNGETAIGSLSDNHIFLGAYTPNSDSIATIAKFKLPANFLDDTSATTTTTKNSDAIRQAVEESVKSKGKVDQTDYSKGGVTAAGDIVFPSAASKGWNRIGDGTFEKTTPEPKGWDKMTPDQKKAYEEKQTEDDMNAFSWHVGGYNKDPNSGEYFWVGYAGDEPKGPPPPGGNHNYYQ